jgi:transposase
MAKPKIPASEQVWTLFQTMTVRDIAKKLKVDRRTVQRWKNQGQQPKPINEKKITREATIVRRGTREIARSKREHYEPPKTTVPVRGKRQYVGAEVTKERFEELQRLKKTDKRHQYDLFRRLKDKRGKTHYFHYQDAGAVVFDVRRLRETDMLNLVKGYRGSGASLIIIRRLKKDSVTVDGRVIAKKGEHVGSRLYSLDSGIFSSDERIMRLIRENSAAGQLLYFRLVGGKFSR